MYKNKLFLILFLIVATIQIAVPLGMIVKNETILQSGNTYKFKTRPIDPYDPFIGRYIVLDYEISRVENIFNLDSILDKNVFVFIDTDNDGFAVIKDVSFYNYSQKGDYVKAELTYVTEHAIELKFPFNRYYMREDIAKEAELLHERLTRQNDHLTYALVSIKDGNAIIEGVYIDDLPIEEVVNNIDYDKSL